MRAILLCALPGALYLAAQPAAASECLDIVAELEAVLERTRPEPDSTALETEDGPAVVTIPDGGAQPQENWFGDPASSTEAEEGLSAARTMAEDGREDECRARVVEVQAIVDEFDR